MHKGWPRLAAVTAWLLGATAAVALTPEGTYVCAADGSQVRRIAGITDAVWLPTGQGLLLSTDRAVYRVSRDGRGKTLVAADSRLRAIHNLAVSPSGRYAAASVVTSPETTTVRVWHLGTGQVVHDVLVTKKADTESGVGFLRAELSWGQGDWLAWILPRDFEGAHAPPWPRAVTCLQVDTGERRAIPCPAPIRACCWGPTRDKLLVAAAGTVYEADPARSAAMQPWAKLKRQAEVWDLRSIAGRDVIFLGASFVDRQGTVLQPSPPRGADQEPSLLWSAPQGRPLWIGCCRLRSEWLTTIFRGDLGEAWDRFAQVCAVPAHEYYVRVAPDAKWIAYVVGGPLGE